jgi:hypothetical protein
MVALARRISLYLGPHVIAPAVGVPPPAGGVGRYRRAPPRPATEPAEGLSPPIRVTLPHAADSGRRKRQPFNGLHTDIDVMVEPKPAHAPLGSHQKCTAPCGCMPAARARPVLG